MRSRTVHLPAGPLSPDQLLEATAGEGQSPHFVLAFLPPDERLRHTLAALGAAWPDAQRVGCEAVTQFAGQEMTTSGSVQLFWFDDPRHGVDLEVLPGTHGQPPSPRKVEALARQI